MNRHHVLFPKRSWEFFPKLRGNLVIMMDEELHEQLHRECLIVPTPTYKMCEDIYRKWNKRDLESLIEAFKECSVRNETEAALINLCFYALNKQLLFYQTACRKNE